MRRTVIAAAAAAVLSATATGAAVGPDVPAWAFPQHTEPRPPIVAAAAPRSLPGSDVRVSDAQLHDMTRAIDWFPAAHGPLPAAVAGGSGVPACGFCHLPGGQGRVENATLGGVPASYIRAQVAAFAAGTRTSAKPGWKPTAYMTQVAHAVPAAAVAAAADYFAHARFVSHVRVVEAATVPATVPHGAVLVATGPGREPIGQRIIETPDDMAAFESRDPRVGYTAYVPPGSLVRGAAVTTRVGCPACHGAGMKLWGAGRSPTYIFRQLLAFRTGARHDAGAAPMTVVAAQLSEADMVAVAAYWGSLTP